MATPPKFLLPSPNFNKKASDPPTVKPHFLTPSGMTLHARHQPPPMYGKRGATYPGKFLKPTSNNSNSTRSVALPVETAETNESQFCEACDMELQSMDDLRRHRAQHEKCPVDNCNYRGHPSVMDKHVAALHNSGLFDKFKKLSTPEELAAWRAERKRKYPTLENTLMRQRAKEQRERRGERLEGNKSRFGKYEDRKRAQNNNYQPKSQGEKSTTGTNQRPQRDNMRNKRNNNKRRKKGEHQKLEEKKQNAKIEKIKSVKREQNINEKTPEDRREENEMSCDGVYMFRGTSGLSNYEHFKPKKSKETNVLSSLLGMYGSDEDSEEEAGENESNEDDSLKNISNNDESSLNPTEMPKPSIGNETLNLKQRENLKDESFKEAAPYENTINSSFIESSSKDTTYEKPINDATHSKKMCSLPIKMSNKDTISESDEASCPNPETGICKTDDIVEDKISEKIADDLQDDINEDKSEVHKKVYSSDDEAPEEAPIARSSDLPMPSKRTQANIANDATKSTSSDLPPNKRSKTDQLSRLKQQKYGLDYRKARLRKQNTLLEKLLEPDIRHERNVLLQCVRFVCENNFFGIGEKKEV